MIYDIILKYMTAVFYIYTFKCLAIFIFLFHSTKFVWALLKLLRCHYKYDPSVTSIRNLTRNFYLTYPDDESIGLWHTLPNSTSDELRKKGSKMCGKDFEAALSSNTNQKVIIYCHGLFGYRGNRRSIKIINFIGERDGHVFALDYRGCADTNGEFCEKKCYEDVKTVYRYVSKFAPNRIGLWGHGTGAAIAAKVAAELNEEGLPLTELFLEAPFTNFVEAILELPLIRTSRIIGYYIKKIISKYPEIASRMAIDKIFSQISCHVILLHSKDDTIYPYYMSQQLYLLARENEMTCHLYLFDESYGLGHYNIIDTPDMKAIYYTIGNAPSI
uniref:Hydrolase_4 domain-containing protein n=1 Tax=Strongyloides papillosus TaxID=174720 RepID=A0A0N5BID3_STREA